MSAIIYEVLNKETWEIKQQDHLEFGTEVVTFHTTDGEAIVFENKDHAGQLTNENYLIRAVGTHNEADGTGTVEIPS